MPLLFKTHFARRGHDACYQSSFADMIEIKQRMWSARRSLATNNIRFQKCIQKLNPKFQAYNVNSSLRSQRWDDKRRHWFFYNDNQKCMPMKWFKELINHVFCFDGYDLLENTHQGNCIEMLFRVWALPQLTVNRRMTERYLHFTGCWRSEQKIMVKMCVIVVGRAFRDEWNASGSMV